jgi:hypothetical protein
MSIRVSRALPRVQKVPPLKSQDNELWRQLCERAANEQDPTKLMALATAICRLWDEKFKQPVRKSPLWLAEMSSAENGLILSGPSVNFAPAFFQWIERAFP